MSYTKTDKDLDLQHYGNSSEKFVDPRLQARERMFQTLHLSIFETMGYARTIQAYVQETGHDIESDNAEFIQLLRDYEVTKNLAPIDQSQLEPLCEKTDSILKNKANALANCAQLCAAAVSALNHWRILYEIPADLRDNDTVTKTLKDKFRHHMRTWEYIVEDLSGLKNEFESC
jgi:hypothetical protein